MNIDPGWGRAADPGMALSSNPGPDDTMDPSDSIGHTNRLGPSGSTILRHQHGHSLQLRP